MNKLSRATSSLALVLAIGCGGSDVVYHGGYELTEQEQANSVAFGVMRDLEHAKEIEEADPRKQNRKARSGIRRYGR